LAAATAALETFLAAHSKFSSSSRSSSLLEPFAAFETDFPHVLRLRKDMDVAAFLTEAEAFLAAAALEAFLAAAAAVAMAFLTEAETFLAAAVLEAFLAAATAALETFLAAHSKFSSSSRSSPVLEPFAAFETAFSRAEDVPS